MNASSDRSLPGSIMRSSSSPSVSPTRVPSRKKRARMTQEHGFLIAVDRHETASSTFIVAGLD